MTPRLCIATILSLLLTHTAFSAGRLITQNFASETLNENRNVQIYLPDGYDEDNHEILYPVIYFLHGGGTDYYHYSEIAAALDTLIGDEIEPLILVKPSGRQGPYAGMSWWSNSELNGNFEDYVVNDVIGYIEQNYNVYRDPDKRCIMGHSMGGYGAMMIALKHHELFRGVVSHSGVVHETFTVTEFYIPEMINEAGGNGPFDPDDGGYSRVVYSMAAAFTPNLDNEPYFVDLPIDDEGNVIDEVFREWIHRDPAWLATQLDTTFNMGIFIDALDGEGFPQINSAFADTLDAYSIPYSIEVVEGYDHHAHLPQRYPRSLMFLDSLMHVTGESVKSDRSEIIEGFELYPAYPNPFNSSTIIKFSLAEPSRVSLSIFDSSGRQLENVLNDSFQNSGTHIHLLSMNDYPSGIYTINLRHSKGCQSALLTLIK